MLATLKGLLKTLQSTKNFWNAFLIYLTKKPRKIAFRNGFVDTMTWSDYVFLREVCLMGYDVSHIEPPLSSPSTETLPLYLLQKENYKFAINSRSFFILKEPLFQDYGIFEFNGKTVLDVGGYCGETAVMFWAMGAKKIIIYEPIPENIALIKMNCSENSIPFELHDEAVDSNERTIVIHYNVPNPGLSTNETGEKTINVKTASVSDIIDRCSADIAKFDCEGCEATLEKVSDSSLRKIPNYIIECHSKLIKDILYSKFINAGFSMVKQIPKTSEIYILAFSLSQTSSQIPQSS